MPARPDLRQAFLAATDHVVAIVALDEVAAAWDEPSALANRRLGAALTRTDRAPATISAF